MTPIAPDHPTTGRLGTGLPPSHLPLHPADTHRISQHRFVSPRQPLTDQSSTTGYLPRLGRFRSLHRHIHPLKFRSVPFLYWQNQRKPLFWL